MQVSNRVQISRSLFCAISTIQITANSNMARTARQLANVVDVVGNTFKRHRGWGFASDKSILKHDGIQRHSQDSIPLDNDLDLLVRELPLPVRKLASILVAGKHVAAEPVDSVIKRRVRKMSQIEWQLELFHISEQCPGFRLQSFAGIGTAPISIHSVMSQPDRSQSPVIPFEDVVWIENHIGAFHAEQITQRNIWIVLVPVITMVQQISAGLDLPHQSTSFHRLVVRVMTHPDSVTGFRRGIAVGGRSHLPKACKHGGQTDSQFAFPHFGERNRSRSATEFRHIRFRGPDFLDRLFQIAMPVNRVKGQIEMGIKHQHPDIP